AGRAERDVSLGDRAGGLLRTRGRGAPDRRGAGAAAQAVGFRALPARDAARVRRRRRRAVRDPRGLVTAVPEGRAVGLLLRRRDRGPLQRELTGGHAGREHRVRTVRTVAAGALPRRIAAGVGGLDETESVPPEHAGAREAASSVAHVLI